VAGSEDLDTFGHAEHGWFDDQRVVDFGDSALNGIQSCAINP
jgi:hypothetical protein